MKNTNEEFEVMVREKYLELLKNNETKGILNKEKFGPIYVFIDRKPSLALRNFEFDNHIVWVGTESI